MALALFDLDNTLLAGDSDHLWGEFLAHHQLVESTDFRQQNDAFYQDYINGSLDIRAYLRFVLAPLVGRTETELAQWHAQFMAEYIEPIITPAAIALVDKHRQAGDTLVVITATNDFITAPIVARFGIDNLIASRAEKHGDRYSGEVEGTPNFRDGKVDNLNHWLSAHPHDLDTALFYSDSHNDLPLLSRVGHPIAVDPDATLERHAREHAWPVISLR